MLFNTTLLGAIQVTSPTKVATLPTIILYLTTPNTPAPVFGSMAIFHWPTVLEMIQILLNMNNLSQVVKVVAVPVSSNYNYHPFHPRHYKECQAGRSLPL